MRRVFAARRAAVLLPGVVGHPAAVVEPPVGVVEEFSAAVAVVVAVVRDKRSSDEN